MQKIKGTLNFFNCRYLKNKWGKFKKLLENLINVEWLNFIILS